MICVKLPFKFILVKWQHILIQRFSLVAADIIALGLSLLLTRVCLYSWRPGVDNINFTIGFAKLIGILVIVVFWYQEHYSKRRPQAEELRLLYKSIFLFAVLHLSFSYFTSHHVSRVMNVIFWLFLFGIIPLLRYCTRKILLKFGYYQREIYIVGNDKIALGAYFLLQQETILGYVVRGFVEVGGNPTAIAPDAAIANLNSNFSNITALSKCNLSSTVLASDQVGLPKYNYQELLQMPIAADAEIVFALSAQDLALHVDDINLIQSKFNFVSVIPNVAGLPFYGTEINYFIGNDQLVLRLPNNLNRQFNRYLKRLFDVILAAVALIVLAPVFILIMFIIKATSKGNVFFYHQRIGFKGQAFFCLKFRTMFSNSQELLEQLLTTDDTASAQWRKDFKLKNDPRITAVGKILRKTSLDELPQLFNVLFGQMSLVGPRPIIQDEALKYGSNFYYYKLVHPGITGLWQISGRNDVDYQKRVNFDVWYVRNWSLWYDFIILCKTVLVVIKRRGAY